MCAPAPAGCSWTRPVHAPAGDRYARSAWRMRHFQAPLPVGPLGRASVATHVHLSRPLPQSPRGKHHRGAQKGLERRVRSPRKPRTWRAGLLPGAEAASRDKEGDVTLVGDMCGGAPRERAQKCRPVMSGVAVDAAPATYIGSTVSFGRCEVRRVVAGSRMAGSPAHRPGAGHLRRALRGAHDSSTRRRSVPSAER